MRFLIRKRRNAPTIIIVALVDVLVVLLIFLMVTTTFRQQPTLRLTLPTSSEAQKPGANEHPPLIVNIDAEGHYRFGPDNQPVTTDQLHTDLLAQAAKNPDVKLAVRADKNAPWQSLVKIMDLAKEAKIKNMSAFTKTAPKP